MQRSGTLPPLTAASARSGTTPHAGMQSAAADAALAFDFEMRATVSGSNSTASLGGAAPSGSTKVSGTRIVARQLAASASATALHNSSSQADPTKLRASSAFGPMPQSSLQPLPSHCVSTSQKLDYFLSWGKSAPRSGDASEGKEEGPSGIGQVLGVLTPRTRYECLAQSVAAVPFVDRSAALEQEAKQQESRVAQRSLGSSASSPALLHHSYSSSSFGRASSGAPTLSASPSHSSLSHPSRSASQASFYGHHSSAGSNSSFVRPSVFLDTFMPSNHLALSTHEENLRARALEAKFTLLRDQRKLRKKLTAMSAAGKDKSAAGKKQKQKQPEHRPKSSLSGMRSSIGGPAGFDASSELAPGGEGSSEDGGESSDGDGDMDLDDDHNPLLGLPKRKPGLAAGQALLHQIQAVIRAVADEKAESSAALVAGHAHSKSMDKSKKNNAAAAAAAAAANADNSSDEDESTAVVASRSNAAAKPLSSEEKKAASKADAAMLQSVIQAYMESSGIAGSVAAGGSSASAVSGGGVAVIPGAPAGGSVVSSGGGNGSVKDRDGTSTFTTAKITRDVTLVLNYLKTNPIMRAELEERIAERQAQKRARAVRAAKEAGRDPSSLNKVYTNKTQAWSLTEEVREAARRQTQQAEHDRFARAQERKAGIDAFWQRKAAERDASVMLRYGPEMEARRRRENAENERLGRVQWAWLMMASLIPLTLKLKWKAKEIVTARLHKQVQSFLVPLLKRHYVLNITSKLNENRALALAKIKRVLVRYVTRWKFLKRRSALLNLWKFLTLVKNAHAIRGGLKDSSLRSQIIKIQTWWRSTLRGVIGGQIDLVELKWTKRESSLISAHAKRKKKEAWIAQRREMQTKPGKKPAPVPKGKHQRGSSSAAAALAAAPGDYTHTLSNFNFSGGLDALALESAAGGDGSGMVAPKRIPRAQKREVIARYVRRKRAEWRAKVRAFNRELEQWHREHKHEIELLKARRELGLQKNSLAGGKVASSTAASISAAGSGGVSDLVLVPPTRPVLRIIPPMHELDSMIMQASKSYVLGKLRGATMGTASSSSAAAASQQQQNSNDDGSSAASSFRGGSIGSTEKASRRLLNTSASSSSAASSAAESPLSPVSRNPMFSFTPGSSHQSGLHLKPPPTVGDRERAKRELLATSLIPEQTLEENDAQVDDE